MEIITKNIKLVLTTDEFEFLSTNNLLNDVANIIIRCSMTDEEIEIDEVVNMIKEALTYDDYYDDSFSEEDALIEELYRELIDDESSDFI